MCLLLQRNKSASTTYKSLDEKINSVAGKVVYLGDQLGQFMKLILPQLQRLWATFTHNIRVLSSSKKDYLGIYFVAIPQGV